MQRPSPKEMEQIQPVYTRSRQIIACSLTDGNLDKRTNISRTWTIGHDGFGLQSPLVYFGHYCIMNLLY